MRETTTRPRAPPASGGPSLPSWAAAHAARLCRALPCTGCDTPCRGPLSTTPRCTLRQFNLWTDERPELANERFGSPVRFHLCDPSEPIDRISRQTCAGACHISTQAMRLCPHPAPQHKRQAYASHMPCAGLPSPHERDHKRAGKQRRRVPALPRPGAVPWRRAAGPHTWLLAQRAQLHSSSALPEPTGLRRGKRGVVATPFGRCVRPAQASSGCCAQLHGL
jgi:hypothetical protein